MRRYLRDEKGSILTEYGLLLVLVAISLIAVNADTGRNSRLLVKSR